MAEYTRKEFAALCHTSLAIVGTNIVRGNIKEIDKLIDFDNPVNKTFFDRYFKKDRENKKNQSKNEVLYNAVVKTVNPAPGPTVKELEKAEAVKAGKKSVDWDLRKKKAEALLKERNAEKALLSVKKMYGEMLPTDFTKVIIATLVKSILSTFENSLMNLAGIYCDELAGGDRKALSRVNQALSEELQSIINATKDIAEKDLKNQIKEFSIQRSKGEKID